MGGAHLDLLVGFRIHPAAEDAAAWKHERMHAIVSDDGQFKRTVKWRGVYRLPLHARIKRRNRFGGLDLNHVGRGPPCSGGTWPTARPRLLGQPPRVAVLLELGRDVVGHGEALVLSQASLQAAHDLDGATQRERDLVAEHVTTGHGANENITGTEVKPRSQPKF